MGIGALTSGGRLLAGLLSKPGAKEALFGLGKESLKQGGKAVAAGQAGRRMAGQALGGVGKAGKFIWDQSGNNTIERTLRLGPDALFGGMAALQTPGDLGDKLIAGTMTGLGGAVGGAGARSLYGGTNAAVQMGLELGGGFGANDMANPMSSIMAVNLGDHINGVFWAAFLLFSWTAASIVSGAVIERIRISSFVFLAVLLGSVCWNLGASWGWHFDGWLVSM